MELNDNKKLNIQLANNHQNILPVPFRKNPTPIVEKPNYYGKSPYPMAYQVSSKKNDESQYSNVLEPAPRNQLLNVPRDKYPLKNKTQPFHRDSCYLIDNKRQGVLGLVCNSSGGSQNSDFVRGNQFGLDFEWNLFNEMKKKEYTVEQPVQRPMFLDNPLIINTQTSFYPTHNYYLSKKKNYNSNPRPNNLNEKGIPTYRYPYKTLNNIENFIDYENNKNMMNFIILILTILVFVCILYAIKRK